MSLFSYISFPRQVDIGCLKNMFDESKAFTVGEIKGTALEYQFDGGTTQLPDNLNIYFGDFFTDFQGISIYDKGESSFNNVFQNPFIYSLSGDFNPPDKNYLTDCELNNVDSSYAKKISEYVKNNTIVCRQQLYDLIKNNIEPNEIVEVYSEFVDHINFNLGPAKEKIVLNLEQVLTSKSLGLEDKTKIEIHPI